MNKITVTMELETWSDSPEEWIADLIVDALDLGENLSSITSTTHNES